jgi:flagellar biosynthesis anti-sigma factor FlgM
MRIRSKSQTGLMYASKKPIINASASFSRVDMEIKATNLLMVLGKEVQPTEMPATEKTRQAEIAASGGDLLELSDRSKDMARMNELIQSVPDVRDSVVGEVRLSIKNGTYNVKAEQIAERMMGGDLLDELL